MKSKNKIASMYPCIYCKTADLEIDLLRAVALWRGQEIRLTRPSYAILALFASDPYRRFTKEEIIEHAGIAPASFHGRIKRLRQVFKQSVIVTHGKRLYSLLSK